MTVALLAAVAAAVCYGVASVLQALAAQRTAPAEGLDPHLLVRLGRQLPYLAGLGLDMGGFAFNVLALHALPLFLVESLIAASVGVTAVVAIGVLRVRPRRAEVVALVVLALGLVLLAAGARPGHARPLTRPEQWALLAAVPVVAVAGLAASRRRGRTSVVLLAALAGAGFGGIGIAARGIGVPHPLWRTVLQPAGWALAAFGILGTLLFATALQRGSVTVASAVMVGVETVLPSAVGLTVLGDATRQGAGPAAAAAGFALTLAGAIGLAPYAEPAPMQAPRHA